jgi:shikimate kinase
VNLEHMRAAGAIVCLTTRPEVILARVGPADDRPLLGAAADRRARIRDLLSERAGAYAAADWALDTSDLTPEDAAAAIEAWWRDRNPARAAR